MSIYRACKALQYQEEISGLLICVLANFISTGHRLDSSDSREPQLRKKKKRLLNLYKIGL